MSPPPKPNVPPKPLNAPKPAAAQQPQQQQQPQNSLPEFIDKADMDRGAEVANKYMDAQAMLGRTERDWHVAAVNLYEVESEMARFDRELRKKYQLGLDDAFEPGTGKIMRNCRRRRHEH